jgi:hypothetical protein
VKSPCTTNSDCTAGGVCPTFQYVDGVTLTNNFCECPTCKVGFAIQDVAPVESGRTDVYLIANNTFYGDFEAKNAAISLDCLDNAPACEAAGRSGDFPGTIKISNNLIQGLSRGRRCIEINKRYASGSKLQLDHNGYDPRCTLNTTSADVAFQRWRELTEPTATQGNAQFVGPHDLHLEPGSYGVNIGSAVAGVPADIDGQRRPIGSGYDIGADEVGAAVTTPRAAKKPSSPK